MIPFLLLAAAGAVLAGVMVLNSSKSDSGLENVVPRSEQIANNSSANDSSANDSISLGVIPFDLILPAPSGSFGVSGESCHAADVDSMKSCIGKLNNGVVKKIEITAIINCTSAIKCDFPQIKVAGPAEIYGNSPEMGFVRESGYDYQIFTISGSDQLRLRDFTIDEVHNGECGSCKSPVYIAGGNNGEIVNLTFKNTRYIALALDKVNGLRIFGSKFINSGYFGIWTHDINSVTIEGNLFQDNLSNGILGNFKGTSESPSIIRNNLFDNNHRKAIFHVCNGPCSGGQIDIEQRTEHLIIENNTFREGSMDIPPEKGVSGIELNPNTTDMIIRNNAIFNNTAWGIIVNSGQGVKQNIRIENNMLYNNPAGDIVFDEAVKTGNCFDEGCNPDAGVKFDRF